MKRESRAGRAKDTAEEPAGSLGGLLFNSLGDLLFNSLFKESFVVGRFGDASDDVIAVGVRGGGIRDEDGDGEAAAIGESDETDVVGDGGHSVHGA